MKMAKLRSDESATERNIKFLQRGALIGLIGFVVVCFIASLIFGSNLTPVNPNDDTVYKFVIKEGDTKSAVVHNLKEQGLIKNEFFGKLYLKVNTSYTFYAGTYNIKKNMSVIEIYNSLGNTSKALSDDKTVQFLEGKRFTDYAKVIADNFEGITYDDVINKGKDKEYLKKLINKYWFINEDILNDKLYYPLEGYLFADTYAFNKNSKIEDIFEKMLDEMDGVLKPYKQEIEDSSLGTHGLLTLASVVELEAVSEEDRIMVASVFYNRLAAGWSLGSDVTTYYDVKKDIVPGTLTYYDLNGCNGYNTRNANCVKGLPIGPIATPSKSSIKAVTSPKETKYMYFVADKNNKLYFAETQSGHDQNIRDLINKGLWLE